MKPSRPKHAIEETTVEVSLPRHVVVERLQQLQGRCSVSDSNDDALEFTCSPKGRFSVDNAYSRSRYQVHLPCYVTGEVTEENGKTVVRFYTVRRSGGGAAFAAVLISNLVLLLFYFLLSLSAKEGLLLLVIMGLSTASMFLTYRSKQKSVPIDTELMKQEVLNRIEAVKRWEE